jgi:dipeptidyl aminopeptidase/acylaminoacyl peptidase
VTTKKMKKFILCLLLTLNNMFLSINSYSLTTIKGIEKTTYSFKKTDDIEIKADLYKIQDAKSLLPVIIWIHGGALIWGSRNDLPLEQLEFYLNAGYAVISIDYRLAPETKLNEIVEDVSDAIKWVVKHGNQQLGVDPNRLYLVGHSAGGYLALMSGILLDPPPKGIVSFYGYGDILADWYTKPDPFYGTWDEIKKEDIISMPGDSIKTFAFGQQRFNFYLYCRQNGKWPQMVSSYDPVEDREELLRYCPIYHISSNYPPTLLIHGDKDTDVPFSQSFQFSQELAKYEVPCQLIELRGFGHAFDTHEGGLKNPEIYKVFEKIIDFFKQHEN